jgi:hypothetical protein
MKVLFLDIDGVLNGLGCFTQPNAHWIEPDCVNVLNRVIKDTDCKLVLSSSWRYQIHYGACTLQGFEYLLRSHRINAYQRLMGYTATDEMCKTTRGEQITYWLNTRGRELGVERYVVVDDLDLGITDEGHPFVQPNGGWGLTREDETAIVWALM